MIRCDEQMSLGRESHQIAAKYAKVLCVECANEKVAGWGGQTYLKNSFQNAIANSFKNTTGICYICGKTTYFTRCSDDNEMDLFLVFLKEGVLH